MSGQEVGSDEENAYTLSGSVTGLSGQLTLDLVGLEQISLNQDGSFEFSTRFSTGDSFAIAMGELSSDQTCAIDPNTGVFQNENFDGISIHCVDNSYGIGGHVTGLNGSVILQTSSGSYLNLSEDGVFSFTDFYYHGESYSVSLISDPLFQDCSLSSNSGNIEYSDVTDVLVTCSDKVWTHPSDLDDIFNPYASSGNFVLNPYLSVNNSGEALAVWSMESDSGLFSFRVFKAEYEDGIWDKPSTQSAFMTHDRYTVSPKPILNNQGERLIAFTGWDNTTDCSSSPCYRLFISEYRDGVWTHPVDADSGVSPAGSSVLYQQVALDDDGNALVVWQQDHEGDYRIYKSEYRNGSWSHPSDITDALSSTGSDATNPDVAMDNSGNAIIVWDQDSKIYMMEYRLGSWGAPQVISPGSNIAADPRVKMSDNGEAVIAWKQVADIGGYRIYKSEYRDGVWTHPSVNDFLGPSTSGSTSASVDLAMNVSGDTVIVWRQQDSSSDYQIFKSEYRDGTWIHPNSLEDNLSPDGSDAGTDANTHLPQVTLDDAGNAFVVWQQYDDTTDCSSNPCHQIYKAEYINETWTGPSSLADHISPGGRDAYYPKVGMSNDAQVFIMWQQKDSSGIDQQIFMSELH